MTESSADERAKDTAVAALRELILAGERYRAIAAAEVGLTVSESQAVSYLLARGPMGQNELAAALGFTTGSTTALVDRLERHGVAERQAHPSDRRRVVVRLSAEGEDRLRDVRGWMFDAFAAVPDDDLAAVSRTLMDLAAGLRARTARTEAARIGTVRAVPGGEDPTDA